MSHPEFVFQGHHYPTKEAMEKAMKEAGVKLHGHETHADAVKEEHH
jgi:hypothetical protein